MGFELHDKIAGSLIGVAVGDVLGAPHEGFVLQSPQDADYTADGVEDWQRHVMRFMDMLFRVHDGVVRDIHFPPLFWRYGEETDDTTQTVAIAQALVAGNGFNGSIIEQRLLGWHKSGKARGEGGTTALALNLIEAGKATWQNAGAMAKETTPTVEDGRSLHAVAANGSMMRTAPLALVYRSRIGDEPNELMRLARDLSAITHDFEECHVACQIVCTMIAMSLWGHDKQEIRSSVTYDPKFSSLLTQALQHIQGKTGHGGGALTTLGIAWRSFFDTDSFEDAVVAAVNPGGWRTDTDSYGGVTGAIAGAYYGAGSIPERWTAPLWPYSKADMLNLADQILMIQL